MKQFPKWLNVVLWVIWALCTVVLLIGGITQDQLNGVLVALVTAFGAVAAVIALIEKIINKKE